MDAMTLDEVESAIYDHYQWFAQEAPGVTPVESGVLGDLWALRDAMVFSLEGEMSEEEFAYEFGVRNG